MKHISLKSLLAVACLCLFSFNSFAKKYKYELRIYTIIYNGDTLETGGDVIRTGILKKAHEAYYLVATLNDGRSLHLRNVAHGRRRYAGQIQRLPTQILHALDGEEWLLMTVSPRLEISRTTLRQRPLSCIETLGQAKRLEVMYRLNRRPAQKAQKS